MIWSDMGPTLRDPSPWERKPWLHPMGWCTRAPPPLMEFLLTFVAENGLELAVISQAILLWLSNRKRNDLQRRVDQLEWDQDERIHWQRLDQEDTDGAEAGAAQGDEPA